MGGVRHARTLLRVVLRVGFSGLCFETTVLWGDGGGRAGCQPMFCVYIRDLSLAGRVFLDRDREQTMACSLE